MTPERLREIYGAPHTLAAAKVISKFDHHCRQFIDNSSFLVLATSDGQNLDVSPKGDPAGFVAVESDTTLLLPDRPGNNRIDSLLNILAHPKVALLFMIPSVTKPCVSTARQRSAKTLPCVTSSRSTGAVQKRFCASRRTRFTPIAARHPCGRAFGSPKHGRRSGLCRHCSICSKTTRLCQLRTRGKTQWTKSISAGCTERRAGRVQPVYCSIALRGD